MQKTLGKHLDQNSVSELRSTDSKHQSCKHRSKLKRKIDFIRFEQRRITQTWLLQGRLQTVVAHGSSNVWFSLTVLCLTSWYREFHIYGRGFVRGFKTREAINRGRETISTRTGFKHMHRHILFNGISSIWQLVLRLSFLLLFYDFTLKHIE